MKDFKMTSRDFAIQAMIATLYVAITVALAPLSYGAIQYRFAEFMLILVFFNRKHAVGLLVGCAVANLFSSMALVDVLFGTIASGLTIYLMLKTPNRLIACIWPSIINGIIIGLQLYFLFELPLIASAFSVFFGEFVVTFIPAIFLLKPLLNNETMQRLFS